MPLTNMIYKIYMKVGKEIYKKPQLLYHDFNKDELEYC